MGFSMVAAIAPLLESIVAAAKVATTRRGGRGVPVTELLVKAGLFLNGKRKDGGEMINFDGAKTVVRIRSER